MILTSFLDVAASQNYVMRVRISTQGKWPVFHLTKFHQKLQIGLRQPHVCPFSSNSSFQDNSSQIFTAKAVSGIDLMLFPRTKQDLGLSPSIQAHLVVSLIPYSVRSLNEGYLQVFPCQNCRISSGMLMISLDTPNGYTGCCRVL